MKWMRNATGWIAGGTVGIMVLWLVGTAVSTRVAMADSAGFLFGKKVRWEEYSHALEAVTHQALISHGDRYRQEVPKEEMDSRAWERLILLKEARRKNLHTSDQEIIDEIQKWPLFQNKGRFDPQGYQAIVQYSLGTTPRAFEEEVREDLLLKKLWDGVFGSFTVTDAELRKGFHQKEDKIQVTVLIVPSESATPQEGEVVRFPHAAATATEIAQASRQKPWQLERIAKQLSLKLILSDFLKRADSIPETGTPAGTWESLFSSQTGEVSGPFSSPKGFLVARLENKRPADEENIPAMRESLEKELANQKKLTTYLSWASDLHKRANLRKMKLSTPASPQEQKEKSPNPPEQD